ncbi:IS3 family transposase, partial [Staphylococcus pseudintermedius]|nr:IS3 family transposase [Staphylococcus pseudintermedius]
MDKGTRIRSITKKKYKATTHSKHHLPVYPNLLNQKFKVSQPGNVWVANITYGKRTCDISFINKAYTIQEPREGLIYHSDQGSQYASIKYQNLLREKGIQSSMSRKGNCYDNACIASFHSIIKKELIYHQNYKTREEAMFSIVAYLLTFYNSKRVHSTLNDMSPIEFEKK